MPPVAAAKEYFWTDQNGTMHITDDLSKVPERYRLKSAPSEEEAELSNLSTIPYVGSWILDDGYLKAMDRDVIAVHLESNGAGFFVMGASDVGKVRWKEVSRDTIEIKYLYLSSGGVREEPRKAEPIKYDKTRDLLYGEKSSQVLRRMKRTLPSRSRSMSSISTNLAGYWTNKLNKLDAVY